MSFDSIVGQKDIILALKNTIKNNRVGHACIFSGPKGIGKKTVARIYAQMLLCEKQNSEESCGECLPCRLFENGSNPDFRELGDEGNSISVDDIRRMQSDIVIRPLYARRKIYLILGADKMTLQAQNCLLKTLEEPPEYAVIILTTSNYDALIDTIHSRATKYNFKKNTFQEVCESLKFKHGNHCNDVEFIALYADGVIGTAYELAGSQEFTTIRQKTLDILSRLQKSRLADIFDVYDFFEEHRNNVDAILDVMTMFYRDMLIIKKSRDENLLINFDKKDIILNNACNFSVQRLMKNIKIIEKTRRNIKQNVNYQLSVEVLLMKLQEE